MTGHSGVEYSALAVRDTESDTDEDVYNAVTGEQQSEKQSESIELRRLQPRNGKLKTGTRQGGQYVRVTRSNFQRDACLLSCLVVLVVCAATALVVVGLPLLFGTTKKQSSETVASETSASSWTKVYDNFAMGASRVVDIDGDGKGDIVSSIVRPINHLNFRTHEDIKKFCETYGTVPPCMGAVVGIRGYDGKELWRTYIDSEIFEIVCEGIDINKDGTDDCLVSGRASAMAAIDPTNGNLLWLVEDKYLELLWSTFKPTVLPDLDGDGIPDILIPHGGNPTYLAQDHARQSGRLFLVSGASGTVLGRRYFSIPEDKETYMSPVLHHRADGTTIILFGSGGETVSGCLYGIALADFYRHVFKITAEHPVPKTIKTTSTRRWGHLTPDKDGLYEIHRTRAKGVMVPPVLVDMNKDGVHDMLVSTFNGVLMLLDGETLDVIWNTSFPGCESYSTPAPGYFNDDDVLDFMTHWNQGAWIRYNSSKTVVIDGRTGDVIWSFETSKLEGSSPLVARTTQPHLDAFIFRVHGNQINHTESGSSRNKRHMETTDDGDFKGHRPVCADKKAASDPVDVFLLTRLNTQHLVKITGYPAKKNYYNLTDQELTRTKRHLGGDDDDDDDGDEEEEPEDGTLCTILKHYEIITGVLGDLDGDGHLDAVVPFVFYGQIKDKVGGFVRLKYFSRISKISLPDVINHGNWTQVSASLATADCKDRRNELRQVMFQPVSRQPWTGYLGRGDSIYQET